MAAATRLREGKAKGDGVLSYMHFHLVYGIYREPSISTLLRRLYDDGGRGYWIIKDRYWIKRDFSSELAAWRAKLRLVVELLSYTCSSSFSLRRKIVQEERGEKARNLYVCVCVCNVWVSERVNEFRTTGYFPSRRRLDILQRHIGMKN